MKSVPGNTRKELSIKRDRSCRVNFRGREVGRKLPEKTLFSAPVLFIFLSLSPSLFFSFFLFKASASEVVYCLQSQVADVLSFSPEGQTEEYDAEASRE